MKTARIAIVGGGLSGLYAAWLLHQQDEDYVLFEARDTLGGRIASPSVAMHPASTTGTDDIDRVDLGPTWFWPGYQRQLDRLVHELGLKRFEQFGEGDTMIDRSPHEVPIRIQGYAGAQDSMRVVGGMGALIDALRQRLDPARILLGQTVRRIRTVDADVELESIDAQGRSTNWHGEHVLLAIPPRLADERIEFVPALPPALAKQWRDTATWMAPHAKYVAVYETPFWREQGLSGEARSTSGPLVEIHDASMPGGSAALFGFLGIPARVRAQIPESALLVHCRAQLTRLFGPQAAVPGKEFIKDWAQDPYTATPADMESSGQHGQAPVATVATGPWRGRLTAIASEWSPQFPGYLAGAIEAAGFGVHAATESIVSERAQLASTSGA